MRVCKPCFQGNLIPGDDHIEIFRTVLTIESLTTAEYQRKLCRAPISKSWVFELFTVNITAT
jgi:hypothetical protein